MATSKVVGDAPKPDLSVAARDAESAVQVRIIHVPAKCGPITAVTPQPMAATSSKSECGPVKALPSSQGYQPHSSTAAVPGPHGLSASVIVAKMKAPGGGSLTSQQVTKQAAGQVPAPARTVVITVPRSAAPPAVAPTLTQTASSTQLPANIHIPAGMMLIRSDSGQLMLVSQQALAQAQQGPRVITAGQTPRILTQQVIGVTPKPAAVQSRGAVSEQAGPPRRQAAATDSKNEPPRTFSQETLESVKKCKNFLVTLIKLASSDSRSANMANNVKALVRSLLEGKMEPEEFTEQLYDELKSTPQPCLVPFLKKSLPAVRLLTADPQLFIQQALTSTCSQAALASSTKQPNTDSRQTIQASQQVRGGALKPALVTSAQSRSCITKSDRLTLKNIMIHSGKLVTEAQDPHFKDSLTSYKEDDDINDVASMAGVNLGEENAWISTTMVGSVEQSCQDQLFLSPESVLSRIFDTGRPLGVTDLGPDVVALVSHATQEYLRGLLEKVTVMAERRRTTLQGDAWHDKVSDVRTQLHFLEEIERSKKRRKDEEERETLLRLAKSRSHSEDPQLQQLKQRAKELQAIEEAQLQQREANQTALAAIGSRKKRPQDPSGHQVALLPRHGVRRGTRVMLKDLLVCMEQERVLRRSLTFYKALQ
ncbi:transcription initiation factor TFIID subunit 4-like [Xenentodon cancila]